ncbi:MAG: SulP family inorganic anion transporter [Verrucomicrobia bacterium]|nr:SulP family inorganic anion transporter [Verrucomicrobiota bacterium]
MQLRRSFTHAARNVRDYFASGQVALFPFFAPLRRYTLDKLRHDSRAAANVTLLAVSQAIAFAAIAGLPVVYGVMCTAVAALVAPLFASSRHTIMGPTNATAFMLFSFFAVNPLLVGRAGELVPLLVLMVGIIATIGALCRVADLMQFVSRSVLVGYISGAAVLILVNQLTYLLGLGRWMEMETSGSFVGLVIGLVKALPHTEWVSLGIGTATFILYVGLTQWKPSWPVFALALVVSSAVFGSLIRLGVAGFEGVATFTTFGFAELMPRLPQLFRVEIFNDIAAMLGVAFAIAFLASLENTLMAKTLASHTGDHANVNQDMFSVGMANIACAIAGGMPASGSLTRSTLNFESGARTRFASFFCGVYSLGFAVLIAASVGWGVPLINYIPKAALAALVIALSFSLFNVRHIRICLRSTHDDALVARAPACRDFHRRRHFDFLVPTQGQSPVSRRIHVQRRRRVA